jgi:hypothetical protein
MTDRWSVERVSAAAPDAGSAAAGAKLAAAPSVWTDTGEEGLLVWGSCQGSGKTPYKVLADLSGPRYKCSCPSRKFPCKHTLGLMLLWARHELPSDRAGAVPVAAPADVAAWADPAPHRPRSDAPQTPEQAKAAAQRLAAREERIGDGLGDLDRWLCDQVTTGLARAWSNPVEHFNAAAARLVDAQAPGMANRVRGLVAVAVSGDGWPDRILEEFSLLHLACRAWPGRDRLEPGLAANLRAVIGLPVATDEVLSTPGVRGRWLVAGLRDLDEGKLMSRRVWLSAIDDDEWVSVLSFAGAGQTLDTSLAPGTVIDAMVHRYPGAGRTRALVAERFDEAPTASMSGWAPRAWTLGEQIVRHRAVLAADPWATVTPASTAIRVLVQDGVHRAQDSAGDQAPLVGADSDLWRLVGLLAGRVGHVIGEWSTAGLRPTSLVTTDGLELL